MQIALFEHDWKWLQWGHHLTTWLAFTKFAIHLYNQSLPSPPIQLTHTQNYTTGERMRDREKESREVTDGIGCAKFATDIDIRLKKRFCLVFSMRPLQLQGVHRAEFNISHEMRSDFSLLKRNSSEKYGYIIYIASGNSSIYLKECCCSAPHRCCCVNFRFISKKYGWNLVQCFIRWFFEWAKASPHTFGNWKSPLANYSNW